MSYDIIIMNATVDNYILFYGIHNNDVTLRTMDLLLIVRMHKHAAYLETL